jgi:hypothetical protein
MLDNAPRNLSIGDRAVRLVAIGWQRIVSLTNTSRYEGDKRASPEQLAYADLLDLGMKIGLAGLVAAFLLYVSGLVAPQVPLTDLPQYWSLPVHDYLEKSGAPTGWGWAKLLGKGDYLNILPVAFLSTITIVCYARILPILHGKGDRTYAAIVVAEIVVLTLAASGLLAGGH